MVIGSSLNSSLFLVFIKYDLKFIHKISSRAKCKKWWCPMSYIRNVYIKKICPVCGNEFIVLETMEKKAVYCTLHCLSISEYEQSNSVSPLIAT